MSAARRGRPARAASARGQHAAWRKLLDISGPFLTVKVLEEAFPQGLDAHNPDVLDLLRRAYEEWQEDCVDARTPDPEVHRAWVSFVMRDVLGFPSEVILDGSAASSRFRFDVPEHHETLRPDLAIAHPPDDPSAGKPRIFVSIVDPGVDLEKPLRNRMWMETPAGRLAALCRGLDCRLGLLTNGKRWMLVDAPRDGTTGFTSWYADLWLDEHDTLRAFRMLLGPRRLFGVADEETLEALLAKSAESSQLVTDTLGRQVRRAVEILVLALDRADQERAARAGGARLLDSVPEEEVYEAAVTVMMRLVFLFYAEEQGLLPLDLEQYAEHYSVSTIGERLRATADVHSEEVLRNATDAWHRILATFRAIHDGVEHSGMRLPAYGGGLFDPERFPFLEGRRRGEPLSSAAPLPIQNRTVLHLLEALQILNERKLGEPQRLSFRALDIEQIGHVYEGLLDHTAKRATEPVLSLKAKEGDEPEIGLSQLERWRSEGDEVLKRQVAEETERSASAIGSDLAAEVSAADDRRFLVSCGGDPELYDRIRPFAPLVRRDSSDEPVVIQKGGLYVTAGSDRRSTGTHYTPRTLTEPIVRYTLEPLVYVGPAEGKPPEQWELKSPREFLALKVCDMACGSAAFLVQVVRYLGERLAEAWARVEAANPGKIIVTPEGEVGEPGVKDAILPRDPRERIGLAQRYVVDRCVYGVDRNPLAVDMAKLSLWLITFDKTRPFSFLDHAIRCGDSLLGVISEDQLAKLTLAPPGTSSAGALGATEQIRATLKRARELRLELEAIPVRDIRDVEAKKAKLREAQELTRALGVVGDVICGAFLSNADRPIDAIEADTDARSVFKVGEALDLKRPDAEREAAIKLLEARAWVMLDGGRPRQVGKRRPFHWQLAFPEVIASGTGRSGFHAFVGNPPFLGGKRMRSSVGDDYRELLVTIVANHARGSADLSAYFLLRCAALVAVEGSLGLITTNTIAQGETRAIGLGQIETSGFTIYRASASSKWPGDANLEVALLWARRGVWAAQRVLDGTSVGEISSYLREGATRIEPQCLSDNSRESYVGVVLLGSGFVLSHQAAAEVINRSVLNARAINLYLDGDDLNSTQNQTPTRSVIDFRDWPLSRTMVGEWERLSAEQKSIAIREGIVPRDYPGNVADDYPELLDVVRRVVKPMREKSNRAIYRRRWWQFAERQQALRDRLDGMKRTLVIAQVSKHHCVAFVPSSIVLSMMVIVFLFEEWDYLALLQSSIHERWARSRGSTMRRDFRYTPSDCFETFAFPRDLTPLRAIGEAYDAARKVCLAEIPGGLTGVYNHYHDPDENRPSILRLRELHVEMDRQVLKAYGWSDLDLEHDFRETRDGTRFTVAPVRERELLDRLLALNHERYREEVDQGLHEPGRARKPRASKAADSTDAKAKQGRLFEVDEP